MEIWRDYDAYSAALLLCPVLPSSALDSV